jgi:hypothetical protein
MPGKPKAPPEDPRAANIRAYLAQNRDLLRLQELSLSLGLGRSDLWEWSRAKRAPYAHGARTQRIMAVLDALEAAVEPLGYDPHRF